MKPNIKTHKIFATGDFLILKARNPCENTQDLKTQYPKGRKNRKPQKASIPSMAPTVNHLHVTCKRVLPLQPHLCIEL